MPILEEKFFPTAGVPQPIVAPQRRRRLSMNHPDFYMQQLEQAAPQPLMQQPIQSGPTTQPSPSEQQQGPVTQDYIRAQLQKMANRQAPPELTPGSRVTSPDMELVQPSNFQGYYEQLGTINQMGHEMLGAAQARAAYKKQQELNAILQQQVAGFKGATLQGGNKGGGGQAFGSGVPSNPQANFRFAQQIAPNFGWGADELSAWYTLGMKESGWRNTAQNPTSTAYGIGQFLNSTWAGVGMAKTSDPALQVEAMARYIRNRYGSPSRALAFHLKNNWY